MSEYERGFAAGFKAGFAAAREDEDKTPAAPRLALCGCPPGKLCMNSACPYRNTMPCDGGPGAILRTR